MYRPVVSPEYAPPECLHLMKQCWAEAAEQRPTFDEIFNQVNLLILILSIIILILSNINIIKITSLRLRSPYIVEGAPYKGKGHSSFKSDPGLALRFLSLE